MCAMTTAYEKQTAPMGLMRYKIRKVTRDAAIEHFYKEVCNTLSQDAQTAYALNRPDWIDIDRSVLLVFGKYRLEFTSIDGKIRAFDRTFGGGMWRKV